MADAIGIETRIDNRRGKISEILNYVSKFAFESTVVQSLRITNGRKQEFLKDKLSSVPFNGENEAKHLKIVTEEMQAKIEKMQEEMNRMRQQHMISASCVGRSESLKNISDETLRAKIEKMQEEMNDVMLQCKTSPKCVEQSGSSKKKREENNMKGLELLQKDKKRVFIRSRM